MIENRINHIRNLPLLPLHFLRKWIPHGYGRNMRDPGRYGRHIRDPGRYSRHTRHPGRFGRQHVIQVGSVGTHVIQVIPVATQVVTRYRPNTDPTFLIERGAPGKWPNLDIFLNKNITSNC